MTELQWIHLHERDHRRVFLDEFARLHEALGDGAGHRRPDDRVIEFLLRQFVRGASILQAGLDAPHRLERGLVRRFRDLQFRPCGFDLSPCEQAPRGQLFGPRVLRTRVVKVRGRGSNRRDLIVGQRLTIRS